MTEFLWPALVAFAASLVPGLELRAGIPTGVALGLPTPVAVIVSVVGNVLQILAALYLIEKAYRYAERFPRIRHWLTKTENQVKRHRHLITRFGWIGVALFVLLPLPGTGVWGGTVLARLLRLSATGLWLGLSTGIAISGVLVGAAVHGAFTLIRLW